jgi:hypothetical protein
LMAKKKSAKSKGQKTTPSNRKAGAGARAAARSAGGRSTGLTAGKRRTAGAKTPQGKARRKQATNPPRPGKQKAAARKGSSPSRKAVSGSSRKGGGSAASRKGGAAGSRKAAGVRRQSSSARGAAKAGGTGREETLAQTPETGRTVRGRTNPMPTKRSTGTAAGAGSTRQAPGLERARRQLREVEETVVTPPSSLDMDRGPSAARTGRRKLQTSMGEHHETGPAMTGGDVDADWEDAYSVGDEAPGGDNPTPDQDIVDDIGKALGVEYQDNEELKGADKITERDKHRWELDPASSDDYKDRD